MRLSEYESSPKKSIHADIKSDLDKVWQNSLV